MPSVDDLPIEVLSGILFLLLLNDVLRLRKISRHFRCAAGYAVYWHITGLLGRFFRQPRAFLEKMQNTYAIVTGRATLRTFVNKRGVTEKALLEIIVPRDEELHLHIVDQQGYAALGSARSSVLGYPSPHPARYLSCVKMTKTKSRSAPVPIFTEEKTYDMNFITVHGLIFLYPRLTLSGCGYLNRNGWLSPTRREVSERLGFELKDPRVFQYPTDSLEGERDIYDIHTLFLPYNVKDVVRYDVDRERVRWVSGVRQFSGSSLPRVIDSTETVAQ